MTNDRYGCCAVKQKILFLDFDGVMLTEKSREQHGYGVLDPDACALVKKLCEQSGAKIVVCSSWLHADDRDVQQMMERAGLSPYLHADWRIADGQDVQAIDKGTFIEQWAKDHDLKRKDAVILDDKLHLKSYPNFSQLWKSRVVPPNEKEGLRECDFVLAKKMFGLPIDKITEQPILDQAKAGKGR